MLTEEIHSAGVEAGSKLALREDAAHEKRNWVRLTFDCNNKCIFCLDSDTHDGEIRERGAVKEQILEGRKRGATRLILSGGEPTMHPNYVDFIKLGRAAGYRKIQTVTNGRMFQYPDFVKRCLDAGLSEITFSLHGPNARIHDALVGVKGAFEQETAGLRQVIAVRDASPLGLPVVNVDIVINRANVKHLKSMLDLFIGWGVKEFDLLQVVPFGRAFTEGRDTLFYDLEELRPYLLEAFEYCKRPDLHIWLNRFPPPHLEGFEHLIQDPYKLNDEVRGRKEEFARLLDRGADLDCRDPEGRCRYCYLEKLCDSVYATRDALVGGGFETVRIDTRSEVGRAPVFGGDPASARRADAPEGPEDPGATKRRLPLVQNAKENPGLHADELTRAKSVSRYWIVAENLTAARAVLADLPPAVPVELELDDVSGIDAGAVDGRPIRAVHARTEAAARSLLAVDATFEVLVHLGRATAAYLLALDQPSPRLAIWQPTHERLTESAAEDVELRPFFTAFRHAVPVEGVPACVLGRAPRERGSVLDLATIEPGRGLEIFRFTERYVASGYRTKALRCKTCVHDATCSGVHVNYVRAHGYGLLEPIVADASVP